MAVYSPVVLMLGVRLSFRTLQLDALLFFAASPGVQDEYIVIQMLDGRLYFLFDPQGLATSVCHSGISSVSSKIVALGLLQKEFCLINCFLVVGRK